MLLKSSQFILMPPSTDEFVPAGAVKPIAAGTDGNEDQNFEELLVQLCSPALEARIWSVASKALEHVSLSLSFHTQEFILTICATAT